MSDDSNKLSAAAKDVFTIAVGVALIVTSEGAFGGGLTVVTGVLALADLLFGPNKMDGLVTKIDQLFDAILARDKLLRMRAVIDEISPARTAALTLKDYSQPGTSPRDFNPAYIKDVTGTAVATLGIPSYWLRPFNPKAVYSLPGRDNFDPPREADPNLVFDYRLTLSAYLEATTIRLIVFLRLSPDFRNLEGSKSELREIATRLEEVHQKIREGILSLSTPGPDEIVYISNPPELLLDAAAHGRFSGVSYPRRWNGLYGAVERYAAYGVVDTYPSNLFPNTGGDVRYWADRRKEFDAAYKHFVAKYEIGKKARWKRVYRNVGLDDLWKLVNFWKGLAGQRQSTEFDHSGDWSLREVDKIVAQALLNQPTTAGSNQMISLRNLVAMLGGSASSLRQSLG